MSFFRFVSTFEAFFFTFTNSSLLAPCFPVFWQPNSNFWSYYLFKISSLVRFQKIERNMLIGKIYSLKSLFFDGNFVFSYTIQYKNFDEHLPEVGACAVKTSGTGITASWSQWTLYTWNATSISGNWSQKWEVSLRLSTQRKTRPKNKNKTCRKKRAETHQKTSFTKLLSIFSSSKYEKEPTKNTTRSFF